MTTYPLLRPDTTFDAVILADGDYPCHPIPGNILSKSKRLVCCDGAAVNALSHYLDPMAVVGDGDSLPSSMKERLGNRLHIVNEQEYNDLTKATRYVTSHIKANASIAYIAATGKREDHTLANIFLLPFFLEELCVKPTMITDHGYFVIAKGKQTIETFKGQQVSIFNISCTRLSATGLRWDTYAYQALWQGALNEATDNTITFDADGIYIIFRTFDKKVIE